MVVFGKPPPRRAQRARESSCSNMPSSRVSQAYNAAAAASAERRETIDAIIICVKRAIQTLSDTPPDRTMVQLPAAAPASRGSDAPSRPQLSGQQQRQQQQHACMLAAEEAGANLRQGGPATHSVARSPPRPPGAGQDPSRPLAAAEDPGPWRWAMEAHMQTIAAGVQTLLERHQDAASNLNPSMDTSPRRMRRPAEVADQPSLESDGPAGCLFYRAPSTIPGTISRSATGASTIPSTAAAGGERAEASAAPRESEPARPERVQGWSSRKPRRSPRRRSPRRFWLRRCWLRRCWPRGWSVGGWICRFCWGAPRLPRGSCGLRGSRRGGRSAAGGPRRVGGSC